MEHTTSIGEHSLKRDYRKDPARIPLTDRQIKYLAARAEGKSKSESVRLAGYDPTTPAYQVEKSGALRQALVKAMEVKGLTSDFLANKIKNGMDARKTLYYTNNGKVTDERIVDDNETQHKFTRTALEVRGDLVKDENVNKFNFNMGIVELPSRGGAKPIWNVEDLNDDKS